MFNALMFAVAVGAGIVAASGPAPARLRVNGTKLIDNDGAAVRLTGNNWETAKTAPSVEGAAMKATLPGANVARILALLWDNGAPGDGMSQTSPYVSEDCFTEMDAVIKQATDAGVWVILTARCKIGAGGGAPSEDVFNNATLRGMLYTAWSAVAARYAAWPYIAAYEIMSEPRDKAVTAAQVKAFYTGGCNATFAADPTTPCMVGSRDYYKLWTFSDDVILALPNVIYTFDFFQPNPWAFGQSAVASYPGVYQCQVLYP
eukprot:gene6234-6058_t